MQQHICHESLGHGTGDKPAMVMHRKPD